mmetsp:Transcript_4112/g.8391  ORF Transcript_4112/g.8391 Transcript_4112/m.8391 type:complete len:81 (+) Transcript_4112:3311-3553(+)
MLRLKRQWCAILERIAGSLVICVSIFSAISVEKKKKKTDKKEEGKICEKKKRKKEGKCSGEREKQQHASVCASSALRGRG